jgi:hypothetical protein
MSPHPHRTPTPVRCSHCGAESGSLRSVGERNDRYLCPKCLERYCLQCGHVRNVLLGMEGGWHLCVPCWREGAWGKGAAA